MHFLTKSKSIDVGKLLGTIILHGGVNLCSATKLFLEKVAGGQEPYTKEEEEAKFLRLDFGVYIHDSSEATLGQAGSEHRAPSAGSGDSEFLWISRVASMARIRGILRPSVDGEKQRRTDRPRPC